VLGSNRSDDRRVKPSAPAPSATSAALPPIFKRLAGANLAAQAAEQISLTAVPLVAVVALGAGPGEIGLLATAQTLPFLLLAIPTGLLADRVSKRRLMCVAEALRLLAFVGLLVSGLLGVLSVPLLAVLGFLGAAGTVGFSVAAPAMVPSLVPRAALAAANGRLELARSAAFAAGPALAGAGVAWAGATPAFVCAAVLSALAVVLLLGLPEPAAAKQVPRRHPLVELQAGARVVWHSPYLRPMLLTAVVWNIAWFVLQAAYVPYALRQLALGTQAVGITLSAFGVGMVVGALAAPRVMRALPTGGALLVGPLVSVLASAVMASTLLVLPNVASQGAAFSPGLALAALSFFLFGAGPIVWTISSTTLRQSITPTVMLGCVTALFLTVNIGARPVGAALGGWVGAVYGAPACLLLSLLAFVFQAAVVASSAIPSLRAAPLAAD
jgi:MFS family permease